MHTYIPAPCQPPTAPAFEQAWGSHTHSDVPSTLCACTCRETWQIWYICLRLLHIHNVLTSVQYVHCTCGLHAYIFKCIQTLVCNFFVTCFAGLVVLECIKKLAFFNILVLLRFLYLHSYILYSSFTESLCKTLNLNRRHTCHLQACVYVLHAFMFLYDTNICTDVTCTYVCMSVTCTHVYGCMRGWDSI